MHIYVNIYIYDCMCNCTCTHIYIYVYAYKYIYIYMYTCIRIYMRMRTPDRNRVCAYIKEYLHPSEVCNTPNECDLRGPRTLVSPLPECIYRNICVSCIYPGHLGIGTYLSVWTHIHNEDVRIHTPDAPDDFLASRLRLPRLVYFSPPSPTVVARIVLSAYEKKTNVFSNPCTNG